MWEKQVGERVYQLRMERNLNKAEFGELVGLSEQYVEKIEQGKHIISAAAICKICEKVGVSADFIICGIVDPAYMISKFYGLSREQAKVTLDIAMNVIDFLNTPNGNHALLQETLRQHQAVVDIDM